LNSTTGLDDDAREHFRGWVLQVCHSSHRYCAGNRLAALSGEIAYIGVDHPIGCIFGEASAPDSEPALSKRHMALVAPLLVAISAFFASVVAPARDGLVTVGSDRLHVETIGEAGPTVVFEAGLGNDSTTWKLVADQIAAFARVVLYDRVGLGQSSQLRDPRAAIAADEVASSLHTLLATADMHPPYILVGHSLGGLYMQMFARKYPKEVSGIVLLESSSTEAPGELKTRAKLVPGTAAYLEEEGIAESNRQVGNAGPFRMCRSP
jgi:alpha/beta hydrolase fold